jgi:hypothetical protein
MTSNPCHQPSFYLLAENRAAVKARYSNDTIYIEECDVGLGVFARRPIRAGEIILAFGGPVIDFAETKRRGPWECMPLQFGPNQYFDTQPPGIFVNHSCDPNAGVCRDRDLVALRDIGKDEEIRFDYSTTMEEHSYTMQCLCGATECRKLVEDFSALPEALQARHLIQGTVMSFIARKVSGMAKATPAGVAAAVRAYPGTLSTRCPYFPSLPMAGNKTKAEQ